MNLGFKSLPLSFALFAGTAMAASLECDVTYNSEGPFELTIQLDPDEKSKLVGEIAEYKIYAGLKDKLFELQTLDLRLSQRSYSSASVELGEKIELAHWKRESLFELKCLRVK